MFCTGNPDTGDHCCYIANEVCQFLLDSPEALQAKADELISRYDVRGNRRGQVRKLIEGVRFACGVAVEVNAEYAANNDWQIPDRATLLPLWSAEYAPGGMAESVGDFWGDKCVTFGPGEGQCCFSEGDTQTDLGMPVEIRSQRQAIEGGS